jgi:hypothetical protein
MLLGYGPNPYETPEAKCLTEALVARLGEAVTIAFSPQAARQLQTEIAEAVVAAGAPRELVLLFSMVAALEATATKLAVNPPDPQTFNHISIDTLRKFRAHLWDTLSVGNVVQRKILDDARAVEILRRRS